MQVARRGVILLRIVVSQAVNSMKIAFMMEYIAGLFETTKETISHNILQVQLVLLEIFCHFCIAGSRNEVKTNQKCKPCEFVTWVLQHLRWTGGS